jgi:hypothetical protein
MSDTVAVSWALRLPDSRGTRRRREPLRHLGHLASDLCRLRDTIPRYPGLNGMPVDASADPTDASIAELKTCVAGRLPTFPRKPILRSAKPIRFGRRRANLRCGTSIEPRSVNEPFLPRAAMRSGSSPDDALPGPSLFLLPPFTAQVDAGQRRVYGRGR